MKKDTTQIGISNEPIRYYQNSGFICIPQVLSRHEVNIFLKEAHNMFENHQKVSWDEKDGNVMDWIDDVETRSAIMRKLILHEKITTIAEKCAGSGLRLLKSELLLKRNTGSSITPMHIDEFAFPVSEAPNTLTVWVALTDVPVEMGALTFIPGSHKVETSFQASDSDGDAQDNSWSEELVSPLELWPELNWMPRVTVPIRAGDCTIHHAKTVHMAGANNTDINRISLATVYTDVNAKYDGEKFSEWQETEENLDEYQSGNTRGLKTGQALPNKDFPKVGSYLRTE